MELLRVKRALSKAAIRLCPTDAGMDRLVGLAPRVESEQNLVTVRLRHFPLRHNATTSLPVDIEANGV